jgi:hypothetical protein
MGEPGRGLVPAVDPVLAAVGHVLGAVEAVLDHIAGAVVIGLVAAAFAAVDLVLETVETVFGMVGAAALRNVAADFGSGQAVVDPAKAGAAKVAIRAAAISGLNIGSPP